MLAESGMPRLCFMRGCFLVILALNEYRAPMTDRSCLAIVLAAGEGVRMRSCTPKALHRIGSRTLIDHVLSTAMAAGGAELAVVIGPDHEAVAKEAKRVAPGVAIFTQRERLGTAHVVLLV